MSSREVIVSAIMAAMLAATVGCRTPGRSGSAHLPEPVPEVTPLALPSPARVLLVAPHPDDETLAAGGLLSRLARAGTPILVVFVTSGDGYVEAVDKESGHAPPSAEDYVVFGERRQHEAWEATHDLGLHRSQVRFLGFPDGGLDALWGPHWSRQTPYTSPYTQRRQPPYPEAVEPAVTYSGEELATVLAEVLGEFRPTVLLLPHPSDSHLDHSHAAYFVLHAMHTLQVAGTLPADLRVLVYLVHCAYPEWPAPAEASVPMLPPPARRVPETSWHAITLTDGELAAKRTALARYRTQLEVMEGFLRRFLKPTELFGEITPGVIARIVAVHAP